MIRLIVRPRSPRPDRHQLSLSDRQLQVVILAAGGLSREKRSTFLERVGSQLKALGPFTDADVDHVVRNSLTGLLASPAA